MPISSSATLILRPFGVFQVWSSIVIGVRPSCRSGTQDYRDGTRLQDATGSKPVLWPDTVEISDVLLDFAKPRHPLERGAMPLCYVARALDVARVSDPGIVCVSFEQERFTGTRETYPAHQNDKKAACRSAHRLPSPE